MILADGKRKSAPMVGPIRVHHADRYCDLSALVLGDEPLLGAVPMEMMDLVLHPTTRTLSVNPANPFLPGALAKRAAGGGLLPATEACAGTCWRATSARAAL